MEHAEKGRPQSGGADAFRKGRFGPFPFYFTERYANPAPFTDGRKGAGLYPYLPEYTSAAALLFIACAALRRMRPRRLSLSFKPASTSQHNKAKAQKVLWLLHPAGVLLLRTTWVLPGKAGGVLLADTDRNDGCCSRIPLGPVSGYPAPSGSGRVRRTPPRGHPPSGF